MSDDIIPYHVPQEPGRWPAVLLAVLFHAILFTFLWMGMHWKNDAPKTVDAETWRTQERDATPSGVAVSQPPSASLLTKQTPEIKESPSSSSDSALKREAEERLQQETNAREQEVKAEQQRVEEARKEAEAKKGLAEAQTYKREMAESRKIERQRQVALKSFTADRDEQVKKRRFENEKKARDDTATAEQLRAEVSAKDAEKRIRLAEVEERKQALNEEKASKQRRAELKRIVAAKLDAQAEEEHTREEKKALENKAKADRQQAEDKKIAAKREARLAEENKRKEDALDAKKMMEQRQAELTRITSEPDGREASSAAAKPRGDKADTGWSQRVSAKVKSNIIYAVPADLDINSPAEFVVGLLPDGSVAGVRTAKSSGIRGFDEAVRRAIDKSQPYPADISGNVPSSFVSSNRPKDK